MLLVRPLAVLIIVLAVSLSLGMAGAQSHKPTRDEVRALTLKAADYIAVHGLDKAEKAFMEEGEFRFGEIYVNVIDLKGNWMIYPPKPGNKGKSILKFVDEDGRNLGEDILNTGKTGEGWVEYRWKNPATNTIQRKVTFVKKVPGMDCFAYIGIYR